MPKPVDKWTMFDLDYAIRLDLATESLSTIPPTELTCFHLIGPGGKNLPAWSPDGQWIAYNSLQDNKDVIRIIKPAGTDDKVILTQDEAYVSGWAGERILFVAKNAATTDIYSMNPDGSDIRQLTTDPANDKGAFGTPDGAFIVFNSARDGNDEIYVMRADGSDQKRLTSNSGNDYMATWGP